MFTCCDCQTTDASQFYPAPDNKRCKNCHNAKVYQGKRKRAVRGELPISQGKNKQGLPLEPLEAPLVVGQVPEYPEPELTPLVAKPQADKPVFINRTLTPQQEGPLPRIPLKPMVQPAPAPPAPVQVLLTPESEPFPVAMLVSINQKILLQEMFTLETKIHTLQLKLTDMYQAKLKLAQSCTHEWVNATSAITADTHTQRPRCGVCHMYV